MLEVRVLYVEFAVAIDRFRTDILPVVTAYSVFTGQNCCLPGGWAAVNSCRIVQRFTGLVMHPPGAGWLDQDCCVQADLLVRGRAVMIMGKDDAEATIDALHVHHRVSKPALHRTARAYPPVGKFCTAEERVIERQKVITERDSSERSIAWNDIAQYLVCRVIDRITIVISRHGSIRVTPVIDRMNHLDHGFRR